MANSIEKASVLGEFMKARRRAHSLSQRALGMLFSPPVTTQFISNIERGVTPLPANHVSTLAKALQVPEVDLVAILERDYATKLHKKLGHAPIANIAGATPNEAAQMQELWSAYQRSEPHAKRAFEQACESILHVALKRAQE